MRYYSLAAKKSTYMINSRLKCLQMLTDLVPTGQGVGCLLLTALMLLRPLSTAEEGNRSSFISFHPQP